jgi:hypothetical protein
MASKLTPLFCSEFGNILILKKKPNEIYQQSMDCLRSHKISYVIVKQHCKFFIPHKKNRGGLMLSPYNVHRNAAKIHKVGADMKQIINAVCMELAPSGEQRAAHISANEKLVQRANGLLAPLSNEERFITLGAGHTAAFCKFADAGGRTPEKALQDEQGNLDVGKIKKNDAFKEMIEVGWDWEVVPHEVDAKFPAFAHIAQMALNTANHVSTAVGELETAVTLAACADDPGKEKDWQALALENVIALCVPCAHYAHIILSFCELYGGGEGAPLIRFMDNVAKQFQVNVILGENMWSSVASATFACKHNKFPLVRVALLLANLTSPKQEDGIAKLLTKADLTKLCGKAKLATVEQCELIISGGMDVVAKVGQNSQVLDDEAALAPLGKLFVRAALAATDKGKSGAEGTDFSFDEIKAMFLKDLSDIVGMDIQYDKWDSDKRAGADGDGAGPAAAMHPTKVEQSSVATLSDHSDPIWIAGQAGFTVGENVIERNQRDQRLSSVEAVFKITKIGAIVDMMQTCAYNGQPMIVQVPLEKLLAQWGVSKAQVPMRMTSGQQRSVSLYVEEQKAAIFSAIMEADKLNKAGASFEFWRRPDEIRTSVKIPKGHLVLAPVCPLSSITTKSSPISQLLGKRAIETLKKPMEFFATPVPRPPLKQDEFEWQESVVAGAKSMCSVVAFWWVGTTHVKAQANMSLEWVSKKGFDVPVLKNTAELQPFTKLLRFKAKDSVLAPLSDASIVTASAADGTATKRRKA